MSDAKTNKLVSAMKSSIFGLEILKSTLQGEVVLINDRQKIDDIFNKIDQNDDGRVSLKEIEAISDRHELGMFKKMFVEMNGKIAYSLASFIILLYSQEMNSMKKSLLMLVIKAWIRYLQKI